MIRRRKRALILEPLEGKQLLSTFHSALAHPKAQVAPPAAQGFSIAGTIHSPVASIQTFTANGQNFGSFQFTGRVKTMGQISGAFVAAVDSSQQFMSTGMMRLIGKKGTVDLALTPTPGDSSSYQFTIASGTGAYAAASGAGRIQTAGYSAHLTVVNFSITMNPK
jgi:hypothetical protein